MIDEEIRIAGVIHHLTRGGGVVIQALNLARALKKLGLYYHFTTMATKISDPTGSDILKAFSVNSTEKLVSDVFSPLLLKRALSSSIKLQRLNLIQAFDPIIAGFSAIMVKQVSRDIPVAVRIGTTYVDHFRQKYKQTNTQSLTSTIKSISQLRLTIPVLKGIEQLVLSYADAIIPNCDYLGSVYSRIIGDSKRVSVIHNGVDTDKFSSRGEKYPLKNNRIWLVFIGRIEARKGLKILIESMPSIAQSESTVRLLVVGRAPYPHYLAQLKQLAKNLGVDSKIQFVGPLSSATVAQVMRAADILVFPSTTGGPEVEGLPNVILEGMSSGLPIVASRVCGVPEVIQNGKNGFIVDPGSIEQLVSTIVQLLDSHSLRNDIGQHARMSIEKDYSIERAAIKYLHLYKRLLSKVK